MPPDLTRTRVVRASAASPPQARSSASLIHQDLCVEVVEMCNDASSSESLQIQHLPPRVTSHQPPVYAKWPFKAGRRVLKRVAPILGRYCTKSSKDISHCLLSWSFFRPNPLSRSTNASPQSHKRTEAHTLSERYSHQKLSEDISQRLIPLTAHTQNSTPQSRTRTEGDRSPALSECSHQQARQRYQSVPYSCDSSHPRFAPPEPHPPEPNALSTTILHLYSGSCDWSSQAIPL